MSSNPNITCNDLTVQAQAIMTGASIAVLQPPQSITATQYTGSGNITYSIYSVSTDGFVVGSANPPAGLSYGDGNFGWMQAFDADGVYALATGGLVPTGDGTQGTLWGTLILPVRQNQQFEIWQNYYTSNQEPTLMTWWFIPSGDGTATQVTQRERGAAAFPRTSSTRFLSDSKSLARSSWRARAASAGDGMFQCALRWNAGAPSSCAPAPQRYRVGSNRRPPEI